jgi:hypothetical protein
MAVQTTVSYQSVPAGIWGPDLGRALDVGEAGRQPAGQPARGRTTKTARCGGPGPQQGKHPGEGPKAAAASLARYVVSLSR